MKKISHLSAASIAFIVTVVLFIGTIGIVGVAAQLIDNANVDYIVLAFGTIIPMGAGLLIYLLLSKQSFKQLWGNKITIEQAALSIFIALFSYGVMICLQTLWMSLLSLIGIEAMPDTIPPIDTPVYLLLALVCVAIIPAFFEEVIFRGILQKSIRTRRGFRTAIVIASVLFMLMHGTLQTMPYTFLLGLIMGYLAYRSGSLWPPVIYHFTNNAIAVFAQYMNSMLWQSPASEMEQMLSESMVLNDSAALLTLLVVGVICGGVGFALILIFNKVSQRKKLTIKQSTEPLQVIEWLPLLIGAFILLGLIAVTTLAFMLM